MSPAALPTWQDIEQPVPVLAATTRSYLEQIACSFRPRSVHGVDLALRSFATFLLETALTFAMSPTSNVGTSRALNRGWLSDQGRTSRVSANTGAHSLGTRRMFYLWLEDWRWDDRPERIPIVLGDLPRQDMPLHKALDDPSAARPLRAAQAHPRMLVRVVCEVLLRTGLRVRGIGWPKSHGYIAA